MTHATLLQGDAAAILPTLAPGSVHCVVTSPPYWGLRDYGVPGQLGLEASPEAYLETMVGVFRHVRRVLRSDGTLWVNMGDAYADSGRGDDVGSTLEGTRRNQRESRRTKVRENATPGLRPKNLLMMPARLALALQADGWWLRAEIVWAKPNPMPESVTDRPTRAHEYVFLLAPSERYFYDAAAIGEPVSAATLLRISQPTLTEQPGGAKQDLYEQDFPGNKHRDRRPADIVKAVGRRFDEQGRVGSHDGSRRRPPDGEVLLANARTVWEISTQPYPGAHFATFPEELARRCILAGSSPRTCEKCAAPWRRVIEASGGSIGHAWHDHQDDGTKGQRIEDQDGTHGRNGRNAYRRVERGWKPGCDCTQEGTGRSVVLDPFGGSGTVAQVATGNGRDSLYIDLNPAYVELARQRIGPLLCGVP